MLDSTEERLLVIENDFMPAWSSVDSESSVIALEGRLLLV